MVIKSGYDYKTDIDLSKILVARLQKEGIHPDSLAALAYKNQKDLKESDELSMSELGYGLGESKTTITTVNRGTVVKTQTITLVNPEIWMLYGYCNETGEPGNVVYNEGPIKAAKPEDAIDEIVKRLMGN